MKKELPYLPQSCLVWLMSQWKCFQHKNSLDTFSKPMTHIPSLFIELFEYCLCMPAFECSQLLRFCSPFYHRNTWVKKTNPFHSFSLKRSLTSCCRHEALLRGDSSGEVFCMAWWRKIRVTSPCEHHGQGVGAHAQEEERARFVSGGDFLP